MLAAPLCYETPTADLGVDDRVDEATVGDCCPRSREVVSAGVSRSNSTARAVGDVLPIRRRKSRSSTKTGAAVPPPPVTDGEALTLSNVHAVSIGGGPPIPTYTRPGLPFGLRAVAVEAPGVFGPESRLLLRRFIALDEHDNPLPQPTTSTPPRALERSEAGAGWHRPQDPSRGVCSIKAIRLRGITAQWGDVVTHLKSVEGIIGDGFISCIDTEYYFQKWPFDAAVLLDAEHPLTATPVAIPNLSPVHGHPGIFSAIGGNGKILARRIHKAWLVLEGGYTLQQRLTVFQHLHMTIPAR